MPSSIPNIGAPANKALEKINITTLDQLTKIDENGLLSLHGIGPKAVALLKEAMEKENLSLLKEPVHSFKTDFLVFGDLKCDNAPKKRVIRDYLILLGMKDKNLLLEYVHADVAVHTILRESTQGIDDLLQTAMTTEETISSLALHQIITHGKEGAVHGAVTFQSGIQKYFAEFYVFENHKKEARIKTITRYTINGS